MKFRKKPVVIEAMRWTGENTPEIKLFCPAIMEILDIPRRLMIPTMEGQMHAAAGDWIIKGVKGEFYPCKPDIFAATYERAE